VALALVHAQELHMIHRDIKPDNIMINKKGVVKLADLGLAKVTDDEGSLTQTGSGFGTPYYMAPEQAKDAKYVDGRTDIYALGATLYRVLAGQVPFPGETPMQVLLKKEQGTFPKASSHNPDVPGQVNLLIDKMMAKDPAHRHQSAVELVADLDRLGLHGDRLSFIADAGTSGAVGSGAASRTPTPAPSAPKASAGPKPAKKSVKPAPAPVAAATDDNTWYLHVRSETGKTNKVKLDTGRVCELIRKGEIDELAEASHSPKGPFKRLAAYREFEPLLAARVAKKRIEKHTPRAAVKLSQYVANIEKEERWYRLRRRIREAGNAILTWVLAAVILIGGGFGIYNYIIKPKLDTAQTPPAKTQ
jgi:serine/threonine-protein kinase